MKLSEKIYICRKRMGLSQEALAEQLGVSRQAVSKWETGDAEPELAKLRALAAAFGVSTDWLLSEEDPPAAPAPQDAVLNDAPPAAASPLPHGGDWLDRLPGTISTLLRRYGWLLGVRIAIGGALFIALGAVAKTIADNMFAGFGSSMNMMGGMFPGGYTVNYGGGVFDTGISMFNPVSSLATFIIWLGVVMLIGGIVLAIALKKLDKK